MMISPKILLLIITSFCLNTKNYDHCYEKITTCIGSIAGSEVNSTTTKASDCMRKYKK